MLDDMAMDVRLTRTNPPSTLATTFRRHTGKHYEKIDVSLDLKYGKEVPLEKVSCIKQQKTK